MVLLRLSVKVYPADLRDRDGRNKNQSSSDTTAAEPAGFLLLLHDPEVVTLAGLAAMTRERWKKLRPNAGPLQIKNIVDDDNPSFDLDPDMTTADVWVDQGKARADGHDQNATARVIQKPAPYAPVRFPSVEQDSNVAASSYEISKQRKAEESALKHPRIPEEPPLESSHEATPAGVAQPLRSVESDNPHFLAFKEWFISQGDPSNSESGAPSEPSDSKRMESQELGDLPVQRLPEKQQHSAKPVEKKDDGAEYEIEYESASGGESEYESCSVETGAELSDGSFNDIGEEADKHDIYEDENISKAPKTGIGRSTRAKRGLQGGPSAAVQLGKRKVKEGGDMPASKGRRLNLLSRPALSGGSQGDVAMGPSKDTFGQDENASDENELGHDDSPERRVKFDRLSIPQNALQSDGAARRRFLRPAATRSQPKTQKSFLQPTSSPPEPDNAAIEKGKHLSSALRSNSQSSQPSPRRYVSFADGQDLRLKKGPGAKAQPHDSDYNPGPSVSLQSAPREESPDTTSVVYPPGVSAEMIKNIVREADEKLARQAEQTREYERRIEAAKEQSLNPEYLRQLEIVLRTWKEFLNLEQNFKRQKQMPAVRRLEYRHNQEAKALQKMERLGKAASSNAGHAANRSGSEKQTVQSRTPGGIGGERTRTNNSQVRVGFTAGHSAGHAPNNDSPHTGPVPISAATRTSINKSRLQRGDNIRDRAAAQGGANSSPLGTSSINKSVPEPSSATSTSTAASRSQPAGKGVVGQKPVPQVVIKTGVKRPLVSTSPTHSASPVNAKGQLSRPARSPGSSDVGDLPSLDKLIRTTVDGESPQKPRNVMDAETGSQSDVVRPSSGPAYIPSLPTERSSPVSAPRPDRTSLKDLLDDQKTTKVPRTEQHGGRMSPSSQRKMPYVLPPESESSEGEESNINSHSSYSDNGDITSTGAVQRLRSPRRKGML